MHQQGETLTCCLPVWLPLSSHSVLGLSICHRSNHWFKCCYTDGHNKIQTYILSPVSPLCAVVVTWFTVTLPVWVFEDQSSLPIVHSSGTRGHAVRPVSKVGTRHTLVCTLSEENRTLSHWVFWPEMNQSILQVFCFCAVLIDWFQLRFRPYCIGFFIYWVKGGRDWWKKSLNGSNQQFWQYVVKICCRFYIWVDIVPRASEV